MKRIFVSGPYSQPDQARNVASAMEAADDLMDLGLAPYCPHLSHFQNISNGRVVLPAPLPVRFLAIHAGDLHGDLVRLDDGGGERHGIGGC